MTEIYEAPIGIPFVFPPPVVVAFPPPRFHLRKMIACMVFGHIWRAMCTPYLVEQRCDRCFMHIKFGDDS